MRELYLNDEQVFENKEKKPVSNQSFLFCLRMCLHAVYDDDWLTDWILHLTCSGHGKLTSRVFAMKSEFKSESAGNKFVQWNEEKKGTLKIVSRVLQ